MRIPRVQNIIFKKWNSIWKSLEASFLWTEKNYEFQGLGKEIFQANCSVCHIGGTNIIIPEKNLKKNALEANGMNSLNAISYQIINGKNGMPAFGGRLQENEIEILASYVLKQSLTNFIEN